MDNITYTCNFHGEWYDSKVMELYALWTGELMASPSLSTNNKLVVAWDNDKAVGAAKLVIFGDPLRNRSIGLVEDVFVHPNYRRLNVGSGLMREIEKRAKDYGCKTIKLTSRKTAGQALYRSLGYREGSSFYKDLDRDSRIITVCIAGYFDPIHGGHLDHIEKAKALGDRLVVIAGTEKQCDNKVSHNGKHFLGWEEKVRLLTKLGATLVVSNIDTDGTCASTLRYVKPDIFAKGEDFNPGNLPKRELEACKDIGCEIRFGVGSRINESRRYWSNK